MATQQQLDLTYLKMAEVLAELSTARRAKVGCLIVKDTHIIAEGYNGTPKGFDNNCENETTEGLVTKPEVLHAESNAITKLAKSTNSSEGATLYCTLEPCIECSKLIIQAGIKRVVFSKFHRNSGINMLFMAGVIVQIYENNK